MRCMKPKTLRMKTKKRPSVLGLLLFLVAANAGKSSLLNAIMGKKLAIASSTAQTTRHRFRAIYTTDTSQMIIVDTPGVHKPHDALGEGA